MAISEKRGSVLDEKSALAREAQDLEEYARSIGADVFGIAAAEAFTEFPDKPQPEVFVPGAKSVVVLGVANTPGLFASVSTPELAEISPNGSEYAARSAKYMDRPPAGAERYFLNDELAQLTNDVIRIGYKTSWKLRHEGYHAFYFTPFSQDARFRTAAFYLMPAMYLAGLGQMGFNCSILHPEFGPRVWVTAIITDKELPAGKPLGGHYYEGCKSCLECVKNCPSRALDGKGWKNVWRCASYGCCGTCLSVCPIGKTAPAATAAA